MSSNWEKIKWLFKTFWQFHRTSYPKTKWGVNIILLSAGIPLFSLGAITADFAPNFVLQSFNFVYQENSLVSVFSTSVCIAVGIFLIYSEWNSVSRNIAKVLISAMPNEALEFPDELLDPAEKAFFREPIVLGAKSCKTEDVEEQIALYNAECTANIFNRFIIHGPCKKLYIGGLARVPFLVAYGALLRTLGVDIEFFDKSHSGKREWTLLNEEKLELQYSSDSGDINANEDGHIAIAVSFSGQVTEEQIPLPLKGHTIFVEPNISPERNLIKNNDNLSEAADHIRSVIDEVSKRSSVKMVHLFLSVQSSLALAIGQRYQEGMHKVWAIHNFSNGKYEWGLKLSDSGVELFDINQLPGS